jgi:hypothetical protein
MKNLRLLPALLLTMIGILCSQNLWSQNKTVIGSASEGIIAELNSNGSVRKLSVRCSDAWQEVMFRNDKFSGPGFGSQVSLNRKSPGIPVYYGESEGVSYQITYKVSDGALRCEPTHFWGYFITPLGKILGISCKDPVGSYSTDYQVSLYSHYIYTASLVLLQKPPVPDHHPGYQPLAAGDAHLDRVEWGWTGDQIPYEFSRPLRSSL